MKTNDQIQAALGLCKRNSCSKSCPYHGERACYVKMLLETGILIRQLERERDTAVGLIKELGTCNCCKHESFCPHTIPDCMNCKDIRCPCYSCGHQSKWEWCGIQEVE